MSQPLWDSFDAALTAIAETALLARTPAIKVAADPDWKALLSDPRLLAGLAGAGVGGLGGALLGTHPRRDAALGALAGGGVGAGLAHLGRDAMPVSAEEQAATGKSQAARQTLGVLGADEKAINSAVGRQQRGEQSEHRTVRDIKHSVPGVASQLRHLPDAFGTALEQGRVDDAAAQADVAGLKNILPTSSHFSPLTALTGLGANAAARVGVDYAAGRGGDVDAAARLLGGNLRHVAPESVRNHLSATLPSAVATGGQIRGHDAFQKRLPSKFVDSKAFEEIGLGHKPIDPMTRQHIETALVNHAPEAAGSRYRRITGGTLPLLAGMTPLLLREWLSGKGYRSGNQPARDLAGAVTTLGGRKKS